jgi:hypothetical protein
MSSSAHQESVAEFEMPCLQTHCPFPLRSSPYSVPADLFLTRFLFPTSYTTSFTPWYQLPNGYHDIQDDNTYFTPYHDSSAQSPPITMQDVCPQPPHYYQIDSQEPMDEHNSHALSLEQTEMEFDWVSGNTYVLSLFPGAHG